MALPPALRYGPNWSPTARTVVNVLGGVSLVVLVGWLASDALSSPPKWRAPAPRGLRTSGGIGGANSIGDALSQLQGAMQVAQGAYNAAVGGILASDWDAVCGSDAVGFVGYNAESVIAAVSDYVAAAESSSDPSVAALVTKTDQMLTAAAYALQQTNNELGVYWGTTFVPTVVGDAQAAYTAAGNVVTYLGVALASAKAALAALNAPPQPLPPPPTPTTIPVAVAAAASAAADAMLADDTYCDHVGVSGTAVNRALHAFKATWNAAFPGQPVPVGTGTYEQATADAMTQALGWSAPPAC